MEQNQIYAGIWFIYAIVCYLIGKPENGRVGVICGTIWAASM